MSVRTLCPNIFHIGINDWDRQVFDALIPLPLGTSYNSYVVKGSEKIAIIDTAEPEKREEYFDRIQALNLDHVDYLVSDHAEQDHSGLIPDLMKMHPKMQIVTNAKCKDLLISFFHISEEKIRVVGEGERISLGDKTLQFMIAPWVHWPDTMFTYVPEDQVLFTTDFFGAHIAASETFVKDKYRVYDAAKRYYAQIMMPFRANARNNLLKVQDLEVKLIAPSHGQVYDEPSFIMDAYRDWTGEEVKNEVIIPYISMHGSTRKMVEILADYLVERDISVKLFNLDNADTGEVAMALVDAATLVLGTPAVLAGAHPKAVYGAYLINSLRPKTKFVSYIGSYGWASKHIDQVKGLISNLQVDLIDPVLAKGYPTQEVYQQLERLSENILERHKELGLL
jgi:flavorubredoxin